MNRVLRDTTLSRHTRNFSKNRCTCSFDSGTMSNVCKLRLVQYIRRIISWIITLQYWNAI